MLHFRTITVAALALLATALLTASTGSGIEESLPIDRAPARAEVAAALVPAPKPGLHKTPVGDVGTRKQLFMKQILPHIERENARIANDRSRLITLAARLPLTDRDRAYLRQLAREYRVPETRSDAALIDALLVRVDKLPPSLVLAQAAIESAWGTSRFAREGNNLFGQWCFTAGCGIVPEGRAEDASHEVRRFASVEESIHGYFMNINTHRAYRPLRELRSCQRDQGVPLTGPTLAGGLERYSAIGERYIETVRQVIRANRWESLDHGQAQLALVRYGDTGCDVDRTPDGSGQAIAAGR